MAYFKFLILALLVTVSQSHPLENNEDELVRVARSPHLFKHKKHGILGQLLGGGGGGEQHYPQPHYPEPHYPEHGGHGPEGGSFAGSFAGSSGHGGQSQSQSASFGFGSFTASLSQSQSQGGGREHDFFDY